jgi:hypothetical protein
VNQIPLAQDRIQWRALAHTVTSLRVDNTRGISEETEQLLTSVDEIYFMELVMLHPMLTEYKVNAVRLRLRSL